MLTLAVLVFLAFLLLSFLFFDAYMYPVCPQCGDNLNSRRLGFGTAMAHCRRHGDFVTISQRA